MGWDLVAIKPKHCSNDELYNNDIHESMHRIWRHWRNGFIDNEETIELPSELKYFYFYIDDSCSAHNIACTIDTFLTENRIDNYDLKYIREWLMFWADKGATFYLSM